MSRPPGDPRLRTPWEHRDPPGRLRGRRVSPYEADPGGPRRAESVAAPLVIPVTANAWDGGFHRGGHPFHPGHFHHGGCCFFGGFAAGVLTGAVLGSAVAPVYAYPARIHLPYACLCAAAADLLVLLLEPWSLLSLRSELPGTLGTSAGPVGDGSRHRMTAGPARRDAPRSRCWPGRPIRDSPAVVGGGSVSSVPP
jgi:hypothetical protein